MNGNLVQKSALTSVSFTAVGDSSGARAKYLGFLLHCTLKR